MKRIEPSLKVFLSGIISFTTENRSKSVETASNFLKTLSNWSCSREQNLTLMHLWYENLNQRWNQTMRECLFVDAVIFSHEGNFIRMQADIIQ